MTAQEIIARLKAEVERLKVDYLNRSYTFVPKAMQDLLDFLSDLEKECEKPTTAEGLEEEIERYLHSLGVGYGGWVDGMEDDDLRGIARYFAQWQKEQIFKDSVEGEVIKLGETDLSIYIELKEINQVLQYLGVDGGDRVKLIIIPEDGK